VGSLLCYVLTLAVFYASSLLILLAPVVVLWTLLVGLTLAPIIVSEREQHTWDTLRTTPLSVETILLGKMSGALWWLRDLMRLLGVGLVIGALGVGLASLTLSSSTTNAHSEQWPTHILCALAAFLPPLIAVIFVFDRVQQFVLMVTATLAISSSTQSSRAALTASGAVTLAIWLADVGAGGVLLAQRSGAVSGSLGADLLALATLGPAVGYLVKLAPGTVALYVAGTLLVREIAVRGLWRWTVRAAHRW
jgi:hypothetical protein